MKRKKQRPNPAGAPSPKNTGRPARPTPLWRREWVQALCLVAITFIAYQPVWHAGFIIDDKGWLDESPALKGGHTLYRLWFTSSMLDYFPLTSTTLWLEWLLWGQNPLGYHMVNVLLHAMSSVLLWRVFRHLKIPGALLAAAMFALHPVNVESVAWIAERKNTLAMFFFAVALLWWLKFDEGGARRWYGLALAAFALALLSKTAAAPLPLVLLGIGWWRRGRVTWPDFWRAVPFFAVAAALGLVTEWFIHFHAIGHGAVRTDSFAARLAGAGWAVWFYIYKALLPLNLIFIYPRWRIDAHNVLSYVPLVLLIVAFVWCGRSPRPWAKPLFFGLAYFVVMLLPVLGFLNIYFMIYSLVADHWEYFAILGPIALVAGLIKKPAVAGMLLLALGALTWRQCGFYAGRETLWQETIRHNPDCWIAYNDLGGMLDRKGDMDGAMADYRKALEINPGYADAHYNLGNALFQKGQLNESIVQYQKALEIDDNRAETHNNLANAFFQEGNVDEAIDHYQKALQIDPDYEDSYNNLAAALLRKGRDAEALDCFRKALQLKPENPQALNNLAWLLATKRDGSAREGGEALDLAQRANALCRGGNPVVLRTLAAALARVGRLGDAVSNAEKGIALARAAGQQSLADELTEELKRYKAGVSFHP